MKRLEQWSLITVSDPFKAPEQRLMIAYGEVYDDTRRPDGDLIQTSPVEHIDYAARCIVTRSGSVYSLGTPTPGYLEVMRGRDAQTDRLLGILAAEVTP